MAAVVAVVAAAVVAAAVVATAVVATAVVFGWREAAAGAATGVLWR
ncbi:hypothetical protein AB0J35_16370 [Nonomuraea angiospora]